ncbi:MAG: hypothetical protein QOD44_212 [Solirubrobacteraceae bacterium]|nr:hypothetical protein [Solirubrobacteraceae bacterium]MEA2316023.1 hypothetical protein [Solirubrobacteraceae bacterium]
MNALRAARGMTGASVSGGLTTPVGVLTRSQVVELSAPGAAIGLLGGIIAGGLLAISGLSLPLVVVATVGLAVPLALVGALYEILLAKGRLPMGTLSGAAMVWAVAWAPTRIVHAAVIDVFAGDPVAMPQGFLSFAVYQVLVSVPFAIGFWWLHENFAPRWWFHIRHRNPVANHFIRVQLQYAGAAEEEKERQRLRREAKKVRRSG